VGSTLEDGVYLINPGGRGQIYFRVWCDMHTDGGGWTVFQKRKDGSHDFNLPWKSYKYGFGAIDSNFWLGLQRIYRIVKNEELLVLRVELEDWDNDRRYAVYDPFAVGGEDTGYRLRLGSYSGNS
jgi:ficolin